MSTIECPYCEKDIPEPEGECDDPCVTYEHECPECKLTFTFSVEYTKDFYPIQAPCKNGAAHKFPTPPDPDPVYAGLDRCAWCATRRRDVEGR